MNEILDIVGLSHSSWGLKRRRSIAKLSTFFSTARTPECDLAFHEYYNSEFKNKETLHVIEQAILKITNPRILQAVALHWSLYMTEPFYEHEMPHLDAWMQTPIFRALDETHRALLFYNYASVYSCDEYKNEPSTPLYLFVKYIQAELEWRVWIADVYNYARNKDQEVENALAIDDFGSFPMP